MSSNLDLRTNRITTQTISSNFFQGSNADIANINCDYATVNKNLNILGNETINGSLIINGKVVLNNTTDAGCTGGVGALVVAGGVNIGKGLHVGGTGCFDSDVNVNGNFTVWKYLTIGNTVGNTSGSYPTSQLHLCYGNGSETGKNFQLIADNDNIAIQYYPDDNSDGTNCMSISLNNTNTSFGYQALQLEPNENSYNTAIGYQSMGTTGTTGSFNNTAIGYNSLFSNLGNNNTAIGYNAGSTGTTGSNNTCIGSNAQPSSSSVSNEITLGNTGVNMVRTYGIIQTLNTTENGCTGNTGALIVAGGAAITKGLFVGGTGCFNNGLGVTGGNVNITGNLGVTGTINNAYMRFDANNYSINNKNGYTGTDNTAFGFNALYYNLSGSANTAIGTEALFSNLSGGENTAIGNDSLYGNTGGNLNTAIGNSSLQFNYTGNNNTAIGSYSLQNNKYGSNNTAVGFNSLIGATGIQNTAIGSSAGSNITSGFNLTCIGFNAQPSSGATGNEITLGDTNIAALRCNVSNISSLSDRRDKTDIENLPIGLDLLNQIQPRRFKWDRREWYENGISDGSKKQEIWTPGFIAQEFDEVQKNNNAEYLNLIYRPNPEKIEATPGNLLPVIVKAIQDLSKENEELKTRIVTLENKINSPNL